MRDRNGGEKIADINLPAVGIASGVILSRVIKKIQNDHSRKAMIEDLMSNDPVLKNEDPEKLLEYYATIHMVAPTLSRDKNAVRDLLINFSKFGRVDMQTLKILAETEQKMESSQSGSGVSMMKTIDVLGRMFN